MNHHMHKYESSKHDIRCVFKVCSIVKHSHEFDGQRSDNLDLTNYLPICSLIRSACPDGPAGAVAHFLDDLPSTNNRPVEAGCLSCVVAHIYCTSEC